MNELPPLREQQPLPRHVRGQRPAFHEQGSIDRLVAMVLALTAEVSVLADRVRTLEALGARAGWLEDGAVDGYRPDLPEREARERAREALVGRVLAIVDEELADLADGDSEGEYWRRVRAIEAGEV
jgi:hypothetical protein